MKKNLNFYTGVGIIFLTLVAIVAFLIPSYNDFRKLKVELSIRERQIEEEIKYSQKLKDISNQINPYLSELKKIENAFPERDLILPEFYNFIRQETARSGLVLQNVGIGTTSELDKDSDLMITTFSVSINGSYSSLKAFLSSIYRNIRIVNIDSVSIGAPSDSELFSIVLNVSVYSYK